MLSLSCCHTPSAPGCEIEVNAAHVRRISGDCTLLATLGQPEFKDLTIVPTPQRTTPLSLENQHIKERSSRHIKTCRPRSNPNRLRVCRHAASSQSHPNSGSSFTKCCTRSAAKMFSTVGQVWSLTETRTSGDCSRMWRCFDHAA